MAYDRYDRDERSRWSDDRSGRGVRGDDNYRGGPDDRGFWDRASDEVASWFGDDEAERRRQYDRMREEREQRYGGRPGERGALGRGGGGSSDRDFNYDRGFSTRGGSSERDYDPSSRRDLWGSRDWDDSRDWGRNRSVGQDRDFERNRGSERGYRPLTGDYGRSTSHESGQFFAARGFGRGDSPLGDRDHGRSRTPYRGDDRDFDPHYRGWRERHMSELDRDYDDFRREHQSKFENDFTSWREKRQHKRGLLGQIREHMEVVGSDGEHVGTIDRTAGDRIILAKSDPESGGAHHSLSCSDIDRLEDDKVILDCNADEAKNRWRDESRDRALFEREDQGEMGPRGLNRSFEGTYR